MAVLHSTVCASAPVGRPASSGSESSAAARTGRKRRATGRRPAAVRAAEEPKLSEEEAGRPLSERRPEAEGSGGEAGGRARSRDAGALMTGRAHSMGDPATRRPGDPATRRPGPARPGPARPGSARLGSARLGSIISKTAGCQVRNRIFSGVPQRFKDAPRHPPEHPARRQTPNMLLTHFTLPNFPCMRLWCSAGPSTNHHEFRRADTSNQTPSCSRGMYPQQRLPLTSPTHRIIGLGIAEVWGLLKY